MRNIAALVIVLLATTGLAQAQSQSTRYIIQLTDTRNTYTHLGPLGLLIGQSNSPPRQNTKSHRFNRPCRLTRPTSQAFAMCPL